MNILLVTTVSGDSLLRDVLKVLEKGSKHSFKVFRSSAQVACLSTTESLLRELLRSGIKFKDYDLIILPGLVRGSASVISEALGVPAVKGTIYVGDLPEMIKYLDQGIVFSPELPADTIIKKELYLTLSSRVKKVIESKEAFFWLSRTKVPLRPPPLILLYEHIISNSPRTKLPLGRLKKRGFEGVILGYEPGHKSPRQFFSYSELIKNEGLIVGVDALEYEGLSKDVLSSVDLVMNVNLSNLYTVSKYLKEGSGVVVIPQETKDPQSTLESLSLVISEVLRIGIQKVIVDPLVRPPLLGLSESLVRFARSVKDINLPHLFGMPNVYELIDADTQGAIALLVSLAYELGASAILVTESSNKAQGVIEESSISREMTYRATVRKSPPIDVGLDLLVVKDKRDITIKPPELSKEVPLVTIREFIPLKLDEKIYLKIYVDKDRRDVIVDVHSSTTHKVIKRYRGKDILSLGRALAKDQGLSPEHSLYLGFELSKAAIALQLCKNYVQDAPIFRFRYD